MQWCVGDRKQGGLKVNSRENLDRIVISGMAFYGYHGVLAEERTLGQPFTVDIELFSDLQTAGKTDCIEDTVHYGEVYQEIRQIVEGTPFATIEALAEAIAERILSGFTKVKAVRVRVEKPKAPVPGIFRSILVEIFRRATVVCFIGLGSNMGDKAENLTLALRLLANHPELKILEHSSWYLSKPVGFTDQDDFMNGVAAFSTSLSAQDLLRVLLKTEDSLGRVREQRWGPRIIDLDLLLYGDAKINTENLVVPHERMYERAFVLKPFNEIAADWLHLDGLTTRQHLDNLNDATDTVLQVAKSSIKI